MIERPSGHEPVDGGVGSESGVVGDSGRRN